MKVSDLLLTCEKILKEGRDPVVIINIGGKHGPLFEAHMVAVDEQSDSFIVCGSNDYDSFIAKMKEDYANGEFENGTCFDMENIVRSREKN